MVEVSLSLVAIALETLLGSVMELVETAVGIFMPPYVVVIPCLEAVG